MSGKKVNENNLFNQEKNNIATRQIFIPYPYSKPNIKRNGEV